MKNLVRAFAALCLLTMSAGTAASQTASVSGQTGKAPLGEVETTWPGVVYQVTVLKRIPPGRLLAVVRIFATPQASAGGVKLFEHNPGKPPSNLTPYQVSLFFPPKPFSLDSAIMTDDLSQKQYSTLVPVAPPGREYRPSKVMIVLRPKESVFLTLQFSLPPPPPPPPGSTIPPKQTVSFLFPKAQGPMNGIAVPPAALAQ